MDTLSDTTVLLKREAPMIGGSVVAFYALIIVLVLVIVIASTAVLLLALEEKTYGKPRVGQKKVMQNDDDSSRKHPDQASTKWYKRILNMAFSPLRRNRHGQGWVQAGTKDEWEWDSGDEFTPPKHSMTTVSTTLMNPEGYDSSLNTGESSTACHLPRMNSFSSDRSTTLPFDVPYTDLYAQYATSSLQSKLPISIPSPTSYLYQPTWVISTVTSNPVMISTSPASIPASPQTIEVVPSEDTSYSDTGTQVPLQSPTSIRTFDRGTKFIEAL